MSVVIRVTTLSGTAIEGANWEVLGVAGFVREKDKMSVVLRIPGGSHEFLQQLSKSAALGRMLEVDGSEFTVTVPCEVRGVHHVVDVKGRKGEMDTVVTLAPQDRTVEQVLLRAVALQEVSS